MIEKGFNVADTYTANNVLETNDTMDFFSDLISARHFKIIDYICSQLDDTTVDAIGSVLLEELIGYPPYVSFDDALDALANQARADNGADAFVRRLEFVFQKRFGITGERKKNIWEWLQREDAERKVSKHDWFKLKKLF